MESLSTRATLTSIPAPVKIEDTLQQLERGQGTWSLPVLFYPDGSSSFAELTIANERETSDTVKDS